MRAQDSWLLEQCPPQHSIVHLKLRGSLMYIRVPNPHFTDEETESQRDKVPCLRWRRWQCHSGLPAFQCCPLRGQYGRAQALKERLLGLLLSPALSGTQ